MTKQEIVGRLHDIVDDKPIQREDEGNTFAAIDALIDDIERSIDDDYLAGEEYTGFPLNGELTEEEWEEIADFPDYIEDEGVDVIDAYASGAW